MRNEAQEMRAAFVYGMRTMKRGQRAEARGKRGRLTVTLEGNGTYFVRIFEGDACVDSSSEMTRAEVHAWLGYAISRIGMEDEQ